jgi:uncharacterized protein (TIGR02001 family)
MKKSALALALALLGVASAAAAQAVAVTANVGWVSAYIFRGIPQKISSASAGLDLAAGPLSLGTWAADVGDGNEVDAYGKVGFKAGDFSVAVGGTGYFYTGDFDHTYLEGNVDAGFGPLSASFALGTHRVEPSADYWYLGFTGKHAGFSLTAGHFDYNSDATASGNFGRAAYDVSLSTLLDVSIAWVVSDENLSGLGRVDHTLVLGLSKTLTLR